MKIERPILFTGPMVRAILDGHKTQTRRVLKYRGELAATGDRMWVRETFGLWCHSIYCVGVEYAAGGDDKIVEFPDKKGMPTLENQSKKKVGGGRLKRPSIHMPRWASRITLEIVSVRVERVQDITYKDCEAEGLIHRARGVWTCPGTNLMFREGRYGYEWLWNSINAKRGFGWDKNPWVWVIIFKRL